MPADLVDLWNKALRAAVAKPDVQKRFAASGSGIPTVPAAVSSLEDPNLVMVADGLLAR